MAAPYASGAIWKTFIQQPAIVVLETLLSQVQEVRDTENPAFEIPTIKVYKDCFHPDQREQTSMMLGVDFSTVSDSPSSSTSLSSISSSQVDFMVMTVLQYSILSLFAGQPEDADQRELVIEMLVKSLSPEEINGQLFGNDNNALHLAAFLRMESTLHVLIAYGGNPLVPNGRGFSAFDILFEVTPSGLAPPTSIRSHRASYPSCSFKENVEPATTTLTRVASLATAMRARPSEGQHPTFQPFSSTTTAPPAYEYVLHNEVQGEDEADYNRATPIRGTAGCEIVGDNNSLELSLDDGPQVFQHTGHCNEDSLDDDFPSRDALGRSIVCDNKAAFADGYDHDDLDSYSRSNTAHLVEKDAQDMDPYYFHRSGQELRFLQDQFELDEFERRKSQLHEDLTCFLRIRPDRPNLTASGARLVSILKNRQAWRPEQLSIGHAQSFEAYEDYTERLQLQRKPDVSHEDHSRHQPAHEKSVQWNNIKQVREYQRHMNCQLEMDDWDGFLVSEPYDEPVEDSFVPTASPYDIVRPVTPVRPRSHAPSMGFNNSSLNLSGDMGRASSPLPHSHSRPLPEIPQSAKSSFFGYRKGTPPPSSFLSKAKSTLATTASSFTSQDDEQAKSSSSRPFSKRLSASSLPWNSKRPGFPFARISFSSSDIELQSSSVASSSEGGLAESTFVLGQRDSTEVAPPLVMDSSQWVPRMLRNLTSPPNSLSKARSRSSLDSSQTIPRTQTVQEMLLQAAPFSISSDMSLHGERPTIIDYDTIFPGSVSSPSVTSTTVATPKMLAQLRSALKERFSTPSLPHRAPSPTPTRCVSTPPSLPPIPMTRPHSEPSSSNTSTSLFCGLSEFPACEFPLDQRNNSSVMSGAGVAVDEAHEGNKALTSLHHRRPSASTISIDQVDNIRAHIPRVTSPLAKVSYSRSTTRSPQLYPPTAHDSGPNSDEADNETAEDVQNCHSILGARAASPLPQEHSQSAFQSTHRSLSLAGVANQFLSNVDSTAPTHLMLTTNIKEDPNLPALPERPPSRFGSSSSSSSLLSPWSNAQTKNTEDATTAVFSHHCMPSEASVAKQANWTKRKEVVLVHPPRTSSLPSDPVSAVALPLEQDQVLASAVEEVAIDEVPVCEVDNRAEAEIVDVLDASVLLDAVSAPVTPVSPLAAVFPFQPIDPCTKHYQNMLVKSTARAKSQYVLPELVFTADGPEKMEYIHGVTHSTSPILVIGPLGDSKSSFMGAALVNIQGISHGLEVQKYNLRQSTVVERFSDVDQPSLALSLPETSSLQPIYQERYASLWMDVGEFESRPRRSTLSNCDSPSTIQTGVLYMRFKKVCNFSLPLPGENTMVSIRIDTGYEKVDTDYVPLEDIDMIINQEFCLPVCPGLAITITLHLMQAPHLQPRYHQQHILPPIAAYSLPSRANGGNSSSAAYTLQDVPLDRPPSASPYMQKSLPALPSHQQQHRQQQQERLRTPTSGSVFSSIGKRSLLSSLFNKRSQPSSPSSSVFGAASFGIFNASSTSRPGTPGWRRPSSPQVLLNEDSPLHGTGERTTSLFDAIGHRSNRAALSSPNAISVPWDNNNSSSSTTIERSSTPSPFPVASIKSPPTTKSSSTSPHARFLQHSGSTLSTSTSASTSTSESSLSTPPSSCGSPDDMAEGEMKSRSGSGAIVKWTKGLLNPRKKDRSQSKQQESQLRLPSRSATLMLPSPTTTTNSMQQQLPVDQEQWLAYWKELGEQHRRGSNGPITTGQSFSPRTSSFSNVVANHTFTGTDPFSTASSLPFSNQESSDVINYNINNNSENINTSNNSYNTKPTDTTINNTPVPFLPQLTQAQIRATESPLEILSRHILFDDELCISRTGIVFDEIRAACTNQIVNIEFQTVNNWIDFNNYSRVGGQLGRVSPSAGMGAKDVDRCSTPALTSGHTGERSDNNDNDHNADADEDDEEDGEDGQARSLGRDVMVANIQTTVCFVPGPEMDPEDAIYEDQQAVPSEPQNLVDCHMGLNTSQNRHGQDEQHEQDEEKWRCLDLSLVHGIETSLGYFNTRARYLETVDIDHHSDNANEQRISTSRVRDVSEDYYPVRNGFRLCMADENSTGNQRTVFDMEFYAETADLGQKWVSALVEACRERPPAPYWMASTTTA
ncbi:hypothetical protein BGX30_011494 [Mortierella sp. GBA39]|nr:hypothetical protein BGX30_011494 [Mortierella sp. GBA39]